MSGASQNTYSPNPLNDILASVPLGERTQAIRLVTQSLYKNSLFLTCKNLLGYSDMTIGTHSKMVNALEADSRRKLLIMPRGTFKSTIGSVGFPIWSLTNNVNLRILLDSELYTNSKNFLRVIKGHMNSAPFTEVFGNWVGPVWNESEIVIAPRTKILKEASITCSGIGAQKTHCRFDVFDSGGKLIARREPVVDGGSHVAALGQLDGQRNVAFL